MLKIVMAETGAETAVLHLEGQMIGPWVTELERVCEPILTGGPSCISTSRRFPS
jgi:hypothetical protein